MTNKVLCSIRLDSEILKKLKQLADKENGSVSEVIRRELLLGEKRGSRR